MRNLFNNSFNTLRDGYSANLPGPAAALHAANVSDRVWDSRIGPGIKYGAYGALAAGAGILGAGLISGNMLGHQMHNDHRTGIAMPLAVGGTIGAGAYAGYLTGKAFSKGAGKDFTPLAKALAIGKGAGVGTLAALPVAAALGGGMMFGAQGAAIGGGLGLAALAAPTFIGGMVSSATKTTGNSLAGTLGKTALAVGGGLVKGAAAAELVARTVLTGGIGGVKNPIDAWFPFFRGTPPVKVTQSYVDQGLKSSLKHYGLHAKVKPNPHNDPHIAASNAKKLAEAESFATIKAGTHIDPRKFALNPKVVRRGVGLFAAASIFSGVGEAMSSMVAPPTAYADARGIRHVNDLGANAQYGQSILGGNSSMNMDYNSLARVAAHAF